ncbi:hypothetical protein QBC38DRAFT_549242 [Podospora fimiseda]|uniref:Uncharacterized protein n=1 Tax=Podospora fimiseda TaxID=252190 RepID=A0AAN7BFN4_9PEZI|nr:hypothetical protein QBC38DRAFT_549242 [Podospora fimiseda]
MVVTLSNTTTASRGGPRLRPWIVSARTGVFIGEVIALGYIMSFLTDIQDAFTPYFSVGKRSHYFLSIVSVALSMLLNASDGGLTFLNKVTGRGIILTAFVDLILGILGIGTAVGVFHDGGFIFREENDQSAPKYPSMSQRKAFAGMPLFVGIFHILASFGVCISRYLGRKTSNYEQINGDDDSKDAHSGYGEKNGEDAVPRTPLWFLVLATFGYVTFYVALINDPFGGQLRIRQLETILTTLGTILLNLIIVLWAYSNAKLTVRTVICLAFLDMIVGALATLTSTYFFFPYADKIDLVTGCWHHGESGLNLYVDPCSSYAVWKEVEMWTKHYRQTWWYIFIVFCVSVLVSWVVSLIAALFVRGKTGALIDESTTIYDVELTNRRLSNEASAGRAED